MPTKKATDRVKRHMRVRAKVSGTESRPRLVVFKSLLHTYAQLIDDKKHVVLASASDMKTKAKAKKSDRAKEVGMEIAKKAGEKNITEVVFDRNGYKYHGRVKSLAEGAREGGLKF